MKKCLIVYESRHHGNTEKIAKAMAEASGAELCRAGEAGGKNLDGYGLIGFGSGIAWGSHYEGLKKAAAKMSLGGKTVFVFSTSGTGSESYNGPLTEQLKKAGASVLGSFACKGFDTMVRKESGGVSKGHPDEKDTADAKKFILGLLAKTGG